MIEYQIEPPTRRCAASGRELKPGEKFFTTLHLDGAKLVRQDFAPEAWQGPPSEAFGFWSGRVPAESDKHQQRFDDDMIEECFVRLEGEQDPGRQKFRYVVALLLLRRKRLKFESGLTNETIVATSIRSGERFQLHHPQLSESEMADVQAEVFQVLGWN